MARYFGLSPQAQAVSGRAVRVPVLRSTYAPATQPIDKPAPKPVSSPGVVDMLPNSSGVWEMGEGVMGGAPTGDRFSPAADMASAMASDVTNPGVMSPRGMVSSVGTNVAKGLLAGAPVKDALVSSFAGLTPSYLSPIGLTTLANSAIPAALAQPGTERALSAIEAQNPGSLAGYVGRQTAASPMEAEQFGQTKAYDAIDAARTAGYQSSRSFTDQALDKLGSMLGFQRERVPPPITTSIYEMVGPQAGSWSDILGHPDPMDAPDKAVGTIGRVGQDRGFDPFGRQATPENPEPGFDTMGPASVGGTSDGGFDPFGNPEAQARASRGNDFGGRGGDLGGGGGGISSAGDYGGERGMGRDNTGGGYR